MNRYVGLLAFALVCAGCESDNAVTPLPHDDESELVRRVYDGPPYPSDFYVDPTIWNASYLGFNLEGGRLQPCAVDSAAADSMATSAGFWLGSHRLETETYFEIDNTRPGYGYPLVRVYKCAFISSIRHEGVPGWPMGGPAYGAINARPITVEIIQDFFDAYWLQWAISGSVVLERSVEDIDGFVQYRMHEALVVGGDWGLCDRILLLGSVYLVEKDTGRVSAFRTVLPEIVGRCR